MMVRRRVSSRNDTAFEPKLPLVSVPLPEEPEDEVPKLPDDITGVSDRKLMSMLSVFVAWQNYANAELARAEILEEHADRYLKSISATAMLRVDAKTVTQQKAIVQDDPEVVAATEAWLVAYAKRKLLKVAADSFESQGFVVSREITRRLGRDPQERRNARMNP